MKTVEDFINDEQAIIEDFCEAMKKRGYNAEWFYNMLGDPTVSVDLKDKDGHKERHFACFDVRDNYLTEGEEDEAEH